MIENATHYLRHHKIKTEKDLLAYCAKQIAGLRAAGYTELAVHEDTEPRYARVDLGRWIIDCACGAGNAAHPDWQGSACPACGAIHRRVIFPDDREAIEAVLEERSRPGNKFWKPGETVADLVAENINHGVRKLEEGGA